MIVGILFNLLCYWGTFVLLVSFSFEIMFFEIMSKKMKLIYKYT